MESSEEVKRDAEDEGMRVYNSTQCPQAYMLMFNVQKQKNFGNLVRSAAAFNVSEVFVVDGGSKKLRTFGSQGTHTKTNFRYFDGLKDVKEFCTSNKIAVCGIEIMKESQPIHTHPFRGPTLFALGNEGSGLNKNQIAICDHFVYIEQYTDKTASLNVAIAGSIVFHHFGIWAKYRAQKIKGFKFEEGDSFGQLISSVGHSVVNDPAKKREER